MYYNLTVLTFTDACAKLVEKAEYVSECLLTLEDCCRSATPDKITKFDECHNNTKYICTYHEQQLNSADGTIMFLYGLLGGATFWIGLSLFKVCYSCYCKKKDEYSLEDLDDVEEYP